MIAPGDRVAVAGHRGTYYVRKIHHGAATVVTLAPPADPLTVDLSDLTPIPDPEETR